MENSRILIYDGSFNGFLSTIYLAFNEQITVTDIQQQERQQKSLFAEPISVVTDLKLAKRVWKVMDSQHYQAAKKIYFAFLSERKGIEMLLLRYIQSLYTKATTAELTDYSANLHKIELLAELVAHEKKRIEGVLTFKKSDGHLAIATIEPEYDILPLISKYFRLLYPYNAWVIYDSKRSYGLYYHQHSMELLHLSPVELELLSVQTGQHMFSGTALQVPKDCGTQDNGVRNLHELAIPGGIREKRAV